MKLNRTSRLMHRTNTFHFNLKVSYARPSSETIKGANLYVCGLRLEVTQSELENMFNQFGTIISSKILTDPKSGKTKKHRKFL